MLETRESVKHLRRKHMSPHALLADEQFPARLDALGLPPWEVISSREFAERGDFNPRSLPDWRYFLDSLIFLPEPEPKGLFRGNGDYYRIDILKDWHAGGGLRPADRSTLWEGAADYIAAHGLHRPQSARETDELLNWLWGNDILPLRTVPKRVPYLPYSGRHAAAARH